MTARFGVHGNNYPNLTGDDLAEIAALNPSLLVVCQPDFGTIPEIRRRISGVTIVGRIFGDYAAGWDAWHLPRGDSDKLIAYGRFCGQMAEQHGIDVTQYRNEPGIDDDDPSWWTVEGYQRLASDCEWIVAGFRAESRRKLGTPPLSPGHQEDDGLTGAIYLRETWHEHDVLLLHTYWHRGPESVTEEWFGGRWRRQLDAYGWDKPWAITEWNRDEPTPPGDHERRTLADDARRWFAAFPDDPLFLGAAFFLWRTGAPEFQRLQLFNNDELKAVAKAVNAIAAGAPQGGPTVPKETKVTLISSKGTVAGGVGEVTLRFEGIDGKADGKLSATYPPIPGDAFGSTYGPSMLTDMPTIEGDGTYTMPVNTPANTVPLPPGGVNLQVRVHLLEIDPAGGKPVFDVSPLDGLYAGALHVTDAAPQPQPAPEPGRAALPAEYDPIFALAGDLAAYGGQDALIATRMHQLIQWRKGELPADPWAPSKR